MNILLITEFYPITDEITGGVEQRALNVSKELCKNNNVTVITSRQPGSKAFEKKGNLEIYRVGKEYPYTNTGYASKRLAFSYAAFCMARKLRKKNDVVDGYSFFCYLPAIFSGARKVFLTYHEVWIRNWIKNTSSRFGIFGEIGERFILSCAKIKKTRFISVSEFTKKKLREHGIKEKKIDVIHNGINIDNYLGKEKKYDDPSLLYIGRLINHKRVEDLIRAVGIVKQRIKKVKLRVIGKGEDEERLKKLAKDQNLTDNIEFLGFLKNYDNVIKVMKKSHVFVHPGTVEGFGITLIEAMACNTPYVHSNIDPFTEVTDNGKGGLIFLKKNPIDLAKKIEILLTDNKTYEKKKKEQRELVKRYSWKTICINLTEIYEKKR